MYCLSEFVLLSFWSSAQLAPQITELLSNLNYVIPCITLNKVGERVPILVSPSHFSAAWSHHFSRQPNSADPEPDEFNESTAAGFSEHCSNPQLPYILPFHLNLPLVLVVI